jgi:hypothetical protein
MQAADLSYSGLVTSAAKSITMTLIVHTLMV